MDNDKKIIKIIKRNIKKIKFAIDYSEMDVLSREKGNYKIASLIKAGKPAKVIRIGATEARCVYSWMNNKIPNKKILDNGYYLSGIFPPDSKNNAVFSEIYLNSMEGADILALWGVYKEKKIIEKYCADSCYIKPESIEPYYFSNPWTSELKGKKVLIVHPFIDTIKKQYSIRNKLFNNKDILPDFENIEYVKAVQSAAGEITQFVNWKQAFDSMCEEISKKDFEIAIIGAGGYGLPLCGFVKSIGKIGIQMSGATQILFGIRGKRWDENPIVSNLYNDYWVRPSKEETPINKVKVEGGSYW